MSFATASSSAAKMIRMQSSPVVASLPETMLATLSLMRTRDPISPANLCEKYATGSRRMWLKKLLAVVIASFVSSRNRKYC